MTTLELLSPARNLECGISAIDHGADAVYIGASKFGARAAAGNSMEDIATLCQYAHKFAAKVYVTVNTIIYDDEMQETVEMVKQLKDVGVDAILLQDMGLLHELRRQKVNVVIHASTQTDNRSIEKVRWLHSMGIRRVVLARELSIEEIAAIHSAVPEVELEVFVHGALCVSYSGQCYASQHCFHRSANRGECAQFCRMAFDLKDADGKVIERSRHLLSLRDMAQLQNIDNLAAAGAVSFKIEGRLKDAGYVKNVTAAYSEKLNDICRHHPDRYKRAAMGRCTYSFTPDIAKSFNRGFTTYFANGKRLSPMASPDTPKAIGEPVGTVKGIRASSFNVSSTASFSNGDGLCFFDHNRQLVGFRVNRAEGNRLFPLSMPEELRPGTMLFRNHDQAFEALLAKPSAVRKVEVDMTLQIDNDRLTLTITDEHAGKRTASMPYATQVAQKPQEDNMRRQLAKLGNTIYSCRNIIISSSVEQPFVQSSVLAELRRKATEAAPSTGTMPSPSAIHDAIPLKETYPTPYLYNAANREAREFYNNIGITATAFENADNETSRHNGSPVIMQCRYCIKAELGYCTRHGKSAPWREPLTIHSSDGKTFTLTFNCKKCEMMIKA
ncbi:MAG: U32 family peptidase [Prevotellaceae bacterium]|nr:U32 family peptidase [Prevotellaceae bacterium]MDY2750216.1 U32 family peptidase [Prevotella sp.]